MKDNNRSPEVADIFRAYGNQYRDKNVIAAQQYKVMKRIEICRTAALGGHVEACDHCGHTQNDYNSCPSVGERELVLTLSTITNAPVHILREQLKELASHGII